MSDITSFIYFLQITNHHLCQMFFCQMIHLFEHGFRDIIVAVYKTKILTFCSVYPKISGITQPAVFFGKTKNFIRIRILKLINNSLRIITAAVINHENFDFLQSLINQ